MIIKGGSYKPLYGKDSVQVSVTNFNVDVYPVTNNQYLQFVITHSAWRRSAVKDIFFYFHVLLLEYKVNQFAKIAHFISMVQITLKWYWPLCKKL